MHKYLSWLMTRQSYTDYADEMPKPTEVSIVSGYFNPLHVGHLDIVTELAADQTGELFSAERSVARAPGQARAQPAFSATQWFTHSPRPSIQVRSTLPGCR